MWVDFTSFAPSNSALTFVVSVPSSICWPTVSEVAGGAEALVCAVAFRANATHAMPPAALRNWIDFMDFSLRVVEGVGATHVPPPAAISFSSARAFDWRGFRLITGLHATAQKTKQLGATFFPETCKNGGERVTQSCRAGIQSAVKTVTCENWYGLCCMWRKPIVSEPDSLGPPYNAAFHRATHPAVTCTHASPAAVGPAAATVFA